MDRWSHCIKYAVQRHKRELKIQLFFYLFSPIFACVYDIDIFRIFCDILNMLIIKKSANILF